MNTPQQQPAQPTPAKKSSAFGSQTIALVLIVAAIGGFFAVVSPMRAEVETLSTERDSKIIQRDTAKQELDKYKKIAESLKLTSEVKRQERLNAIPEKLDQHLLVKELVSVSEENDVVIGSVSFGQGTAADLGIETVIMTSTFEGDFTQLINFLKSIEGLGRKMIVQNVSVQLGENVEGIQRATFTLTMEAYFQSGI